MCPQQKYFERKSILLLLDTIPAYTDKTFLKVRTLILPNVTAICQHKDPDSWKYWKIISWELLLSGIEPFLEKQAMWYKDLQQYDVGHNEGCR